MADAPRIRIDPFLQKKPGVGVFQGGQKINPEEKKANFWNLGLDPLIVFFANVDFFLESKSRQAGVLTFRSHSSRGSSSVTRARN